MKTIFAVIETQGDFTHIWETTNDLKKAVCAMNFLAEHFCWNYGTTIQYKANSCITLSNGTLILIQALNHHTSLKDLKKHLEKCYYNPNK